MIKKLKYNNPNIIYSEPPSLLTMYLKIRIVAKNMAERIPAIFNSRLYCCLAQRIIARDKPPVAVLTIKLFTLIDDNSGG